MISQSLGTRTSLLLFLFYYLFCFINYHSFIIFCHVLRMFWMLHINISLGTWWIKLPNPPISNHPKCPKLLALLIPRMFLVQIKIEFNLRDSLWRGKTDQTTGVCFSGVKTVATWRSAANVLLIVYYVLDCHWCRRWIVLLSLWQKKISTIF